MSKYEESDGYANAQVRYSYSAYEATFLGFQHSLVFREPCITSAMRGVDEKEVIVA